MTNVPQPGKRFHRRLRPDLLAYFNVILKSGGTTIEQVFSPEEARRLQSPAGLGPLEKAILGTATQDPLSAKKLAAKLVRPCNSQFRDHLRGLVRKGMLLHTPDGYRLPD